MINAMLEVPQVGSEVGVVNSAGESVYSNSAQTEQGSAQAQSSALIICHDTKPHNAHVSTTTPGTIIGKASGNCNYIYGPVQTLTFDAYSYLQKWEEFWFFSFWNQVGMIGHSQKQGYSVTFVQSDLVAVTPCDTGKFRTRLALYISGSVSGAFYPHPGLYASASTNLSC